MLKNAQDFEENMSRVVQTNEVSLLLLKPPNYFLRMTLVSNSRALKKLRW
jgi:hypothetical protein